MVPQNHAVDDGSGLLELLEQVIVIDIRGQVANEATRGLAKLSLRLDVASSERLVTVRRLIDNSSRIAQALIVGEANLSADLLVKVDKKDFGWIEGNIAQHFHQTLFCRSLRQVLQSELKAFACRR